MCRKLFLLISFVLVLGLVNVASADLNTGLLKYYPRDDVADSNDVLNVVGPNGVIVVNDVIFSDFASNHTVPGANPGYMDTGTALDLDNNSCVLQSGGFESTGITGSDPWTLAFFFKSPDKKSHNRTTSSMVFL